MSRNKSFLLLWAARELLRRPGEMLLLMAVLLVAVTVLAVALLSVHALADTQNAWLQQAPSLIVRRIDNGWRPMAQKESVAALAAVPGVTRAVARVWGVASDPAGKAVTVIGLDEQSARMLGEPFSLPSPQPGQAIAGSELANYGQGSGITLSAVTSIPVTLSAFLPASTAALTRDFVLLHPKDARRLLGLQAMEASDIAVWVYHDSEQEAIRADLAAALPFPVRVTTRIEAGDIFSTQLFRRGSLFGILALPMLLALSFVVLGVVQRRLAGRYEAGLYKTLGWTDGDLFRLYLYRGLLLGVPALLLGLALAAFVVLGPFADAVIPWLFGTASGSAPLSCSLTSVLLVLVESSALVLTPFLAASAWPGLHAALGDPIDLLAREQ